MTKSEILQVARPILFNTEMVQAIMDGKKTETRRAIKPQPDDLYFPQNASLPVEKVYCDQGWYGRELKLPYKPEEYLYVRETWGIGNIFLNDNDEPSFCVCYKASKDIEEDCITFKINEEKYEKYSDLASERLQWFPSIHMPKEAARIFLQVKDVRVERLQEIEKDGLIKEGIDPFDGNFGELEYATAEFAALWDSTIKNKGRDKYGWDANPWVWVIEFERIEVDE